MIKTGIKGNNPLVVGVGTTKLFLAVIGLLAISPQKTDYEWSWRLLSFLTSPSNEIGDTFAGIAGALAFLWIIVTVMLQSSELSEQRKEISRQADEFEKMNKTMGQQSFENFFFSLVTTRNSLIQAMDIRENTSKAVIKQGQDCFGFFFDEIKGSDWSAAINGGAPKDKADENFEKLYQKHGSDLGNCFRFTFNAMKAIAGDDSKQERHLKLFRSLFSNEELLVIFYNCRTDAGQNMVKYAEIFDLFDNLPKDRLISSTHWDDYQVLVRGIQ
jgi:hypothetical protein